MDVERRQADRYSLDPLHLTHLQTLQPSSAPPSPPIQAIIDTISPRIPLNCDSPIHLLLPFHPLIVSLYHCLYRYVHRDMAIFVFVYRGTRKGSTIVGMSRGYASALNRYHAIHTVYMRYHDGNLAYLWNRRYIEAHLPITMSEALKLNRGEARHGNQRVGL